MSRSRRSRNTWPLVCLLATFGFGPVARGETYAFLVAVSAYESKDAIKPLRFACNDVIAFDGVLRNGGVPSQNIVRMYDNQSNPRFKPLARQIMQEFHLLLATLEPEDSLIVAFAGHGVEAGPNSESYFLPADAVLKEPSTLIRIKTIYEEMEKSRAGRKLLLVDACRNDPESDVSRSLGVTIRPPVHLAEVPIPMGTAALFSCNSKERSFEDDTLKHGIFFHQVIKAWEGAADVDGDKQVTLEELERYVRRETKTHARNALSQLQSPVFQVNGMPANGWVVASLEKKPRPSRNLAALLRQADEQRRQGNHAEAEREYARILQTDPDSFKAHLGLAMTHIARGQTRQALGEFSEAIRIDPGDPSAFVGRAIAQGAGGDLTAALADYEQAIRIDPNHVVAYVGKGAILARLNRPDDAIAACSKAIALDARNAKAYFNRGVAREAKKDAKGAAEDFRKATQLDPRLKKTP